MGDRLLAACAITGACVYLFADSRIVDPVISDPLGPKVFPVLIGLGLLGSGLLLLAETRKKSPSVAGAAVAAPGNNKQRLILVGMAVWTACYYTAFEPVGYIVSTIGYLFGLLLFFNPRKHVANVATAVIFTAVAYAIFAKFLGVSMPSGVLTF
jgi:putative tricarboxylic transport membrane protein